MKKEEYLDLLATRYASIIYATCVLGTEEGNWCVDLHEIAPHEVCKNEELKALIEDKLNEYEGVLDLERNDTSYDVIIGTAYFEYEDENDDDDDTTEDEFVYMQYELGLCTYEDYLAVCDVDECEPMPRKKGDENE